MIALLLSFFFITMIIFTLPSSDWLVPHSRQRVGDMASDRTQRFHIRTAKQVVDATFGEIATSFPGFSPTRPTDGGVGDCVWVSLVQSQIVAQQTNDEAIDFKLSSKWACRMLQERRTLGITERNLIYQGRTIRKVMGGGFLSRRNFFSLSNSLYEFFRP